MKRLNLIFPVFSAIMIVFVGILVANNSNPKALAEIAVKVVQPQKLLLKKNSEEIPNLKSVFNMQDDSSEMHYPAFTIDFDFPIGDDWQLEAKVDIWFYDHQGQFIAHKNDLIVIDSLPGQYVNENGKMVLMVHWIPDSRFGLTDEKGNLVGTGPILTKIETRSSAWTKKPILYGGLALKSGTMHPDFPKTNSQFIRFGYIRQAD
jgi:hypothetical protein